MAYTPVRGAVIHDGTDLQQSAVATSRQLQIKGISTRTVNAGLKSSIFDLAVPTGCDVAVWLSHGGWDGPMVFLEPGEQMMQGFSLDALDLEPMTTQLDSTQTPIGWQKLRVFMQRHIRPRGLFVVNACHSAGSNRYESTAGPKADRWVQEVARDMNVFAVGAEGEMAAGVPEDSLALLAYALDGRRWKQAFRAYQPGGQRLVQWPGWLSLN